MNRKKREQLILDAAIQVFSKQGYSKTSVSEIIEEAKVARGTFYLYFKSKDELFDALLDHLMVTVSRNIAAIGHSLNSTEDPVAHIRHQASDLIITITSNRLLLKILFLDAQNIDSPFISKLQTYFDQLSLIIKHQLDRQMHEGFLRTFQTEVAARCILGSIKETILHWLTHDNMEIESTIQSLIDYLVYGLATGSHESSIKEVPIQKPTVNMEEFH